MKSAPGSFSKQFGLNRLRGVLNSGFGSPPATTSRDQWRKQSTTHGDARDLIPLNFFLFNKDGRLCLDELVAKAGQPSFRNFERLALFAFHLADVGTLPGGGEQGPALWANEFVREMLWRNGNWQTSALEHTSLDAFLDERLLAVPETRTKCKTNYRNMFMICNYLDLPGKTIDSGASDWLDSAFFLAWDRFILNGGRADEVDLLEHLDRKELFKLVGLQESLVRSTAREAVKDYLKVGNVRRVM